MPTVRTGGGNRIGNRDLDGPDLQVLLQHAGLQRQEIGASATLPGGRASWLLADGEHSFKLAGCREIGGQVLLGVAGQRDQSRRRDALGGDAQIVCITSPPLGGAADLEHARTHRRLTLQVVKSVLRRGVSPGALYQKAESFTQRDVVTAKVINLGVQRDSQRGRGPGQRCIGADVAAPAPVASIDKLGELPQRTTAEAELEIEWRLAQT